MKKIYITIFTLVVLMISMTASVFAWFVDGGNTADASGISGKVEEKSNRVYISFDSLVDLDLEQTHDLLFIDDNDLSNASYKTFLLDFAAIIKIDFKPTVEYSEISLELRPESIDYFSKGKERVPGSAIFYYLISDSNELIKDNETTIVDEEVVNDYLYQKTATTIKNVNVNKKISLSESNITTVYLAVWGNGNVLNNTSFQLSDLKHHLYITVYTNEVS